MNIVLGFLLVALPLAGPSMIMMVLAWCAALTAYRGLRSAAVYPLVIVLFAIEVLYGIAPGTLSLAYVSMVFLMLIFQRFIALPPWELTDGWRIGDAVRTLGMFAGMFALIIISGAVIGRVIYGYPMSVWILQGMLFSSSMVPIILSSIILIIAVRRITVPFRRSLIFGA
jgi:hypothetical protein